MKVIVFLVRGFHVGYLGCYGNEWIDTPHLDRLAAEGVVFDQHFAERPSSTTASATWRTGTIGPQRAQNADLLTLLTGHEVHSHLILDRVAGCESELMKGWSRVQYTSPNPGGSANLEHVMEFAVDGLDGLASRDSALLWVEVGSLLPPWSIPSEQLEKYFRPAPSEDDEQGTESELAVEAAKPLLDPQTGPLAAPADQSLQRLQLTYASAVSHVDSVFGWFFEELQDWRLSRETLLIVTSDQGQALGEHGVFGMYRPWLHDELIHLPLLMRLPEGAGAGRRVAALTQSVDLYATLLDAFGIAAPPNHGYSLLPLARSETNAVRSYICCAMRQGACEEWAIRTNEWAFILPIAIPAADPFRGPQLFVKPDDRWEVNNVLQHNLELGDRLEATLRNYMASPRRIGLETPWETDNGGSSS
jgi:arylsulfatase A-like enzyme